MAGIADVINTIGALIETAVYPNGTLQPSIINRQVTIEGGWPIRTQLDTDLQNNNAHISIFPTNQTRVVTKFERVFEALSIAPATINATVAEQTVTITGRIETPQVVTIIANGIGFAYSILKNDTVNSIAAALAELIPGASVSGNVITLTNTHSLVTRISTLATSAEELSRQERVFLISCWCSGDRDSTHYDPTIRDVLAEAIDVVMKLNYRMALPDGFYAQVFPQEAATPYVDDLEKSLILRRDLHYNIQYATTITADDMTIAQAYSNVNP